MRCCAGLRATAPWGSDKQGMYLDLAPYPCQPRGPRPAGRDGGARAAPHADPVSDSMPFRAVDFQEWLPAIP